MKRVLNTHIRVALQCGSQRKYCSEKKGSSLTAAIDEDMDNIRIHPAEKAPPTAMTMETMMGQGAEADYSALMGKATPRGTELFFTERNVSTDKAWVRTLPGTDLKVSAISMACKRLNHFTGEHIMTLGTCLKSGVNFFDIQGCDSDSVTSFSSMAKEKICTTREISRTNIVVMVRVGWVLFRPWSEINIIAPDFSKIPTSREYVSENYVMYLRHVCTTDHTPAGSESTGQTRQSPPVCPILVFLSKQANETYVGREREKRMKPKVGIPFE